MTRPQVKDMSLCSSNRFNVLATLIEEPSSESLADCKSEEPMSISSLPPEKIYLRSMQVKVSTQVQVQLETLDTRSKLGVTALLDSGATALFLDTRFVRGTNLNTRRLARAIPVYNVDGTLN